MCKEEPELLLQPPHLPLSSPPLSNDTQWSITPQQSERCPEASLWLGAIDQVVFFFKKKKVIMITRGHNVSEFAVPLGGRSCSACQRQGEAWRGSGKPLPPTEPT